MNIPKSEIHEADLQREKDRIKFTRNMVKHSNTTFFHLQVDFIDAIINLPQLRYDMLKLYKINTEEINNTDEDEISAPDLYSDYMELIKHSLNSQLNKTEDHNNIMKLISQVHLKFHISSTRIVYSNIKKPFVPNSESKPNNLDKETEKQNLKQFSIAGVQSVIDSITFNCTFYQKQVN